MPMYEYKCLSCSHEFEELLAAGSTAPPCPLCGCEAGPLVSAPSIRTEHASPIDRGVAPLRGYNPTGRKPSCGGGGG